MSESANALSNQESCDHFSYDCDEKSSVRQLNIKSVWQRNV